MERKNKVFKSIIIVYRIDFSVFVTGYVIPTRFLKNFYIDLMCVNGNNKAIKFVY